MDYVSFLQTNPQFRFVKFEPEHYESKCEKLPSRLEYRDDNALPTGCRLIGRSGHIIVGDPRG
jgi:hypothetical protein